MQKRGNAHALPGSAGLILLGESLFLGVIVGNVQCAVQQLSEINRFAHHLLSSSSLSGLQKIPPPDLDRRKTYRLRDAVHVPLHGEQALRGSKAAKGPMRRGICSNRFRADPNARPIVRPTRVNRATGKHHGGQSCIGAAIDCEVDLSTQDLAISADGRPMACSRRMPFGRRRHVFHPIINNLHRSSGFHREQRRMSGDHRRIFFFAAESSSRLHLDDTNFLRGQIAKCHQRFVNVIRAL